MDEDLSKRTFTEILDIKTIVEEVYGHGMFEKAVESDVAIMDALKEKDKEAIELGKFGQEISSK